jgi:D-beta-D-heptose 7-phosphate kinase/D-beta-D-heptose 1-phosphate adenosyltransferase
MKFLVIGDSCEDIFIYGKTERLCPESPAPIFNPICKKISGGMSRNVLSILRSLKVNVDLVTNKSKITKTRYIDKNSNYLFLRVDENDSCERIENIKEINYKEYDCVIISDYNKGFLKSEDIYMISCYHSLTFLDTKKKLGDWCEKIKYIKINRKEYLKNKKFVEKKILSKTIITLDKEGCKFNNKLYPSIGKNAVDKTGAGDCFISSLAYYYSKSKNINKSIKFANNEALKYITK